MSYNESETRFVLFDPVLRTKGYDDHSKLRLGTPSGRRGAFSTTRRLP